MENLTDNGVFSNPTKMKRICEEYIRNTCVGIDLLEKGKLPSETFEQINSLFLASIPGARDSKLSERLTRDDLESKLATAIEVVKLIGEDTNL